MPSTATRSTRSTRTPAAPRTAADPCVPVDTAPDTAPAGPRRPLEGLTIAEAAERIGLTVHTLRYYERDGLMVRDVERAPSGHRVYNEGDLVWLTMLTRLRATGMPIREVKAYADLCRAGDGNEIERLDLLEAHRTRVLEQLAEVTTHLGAIDTKISLYATRLTEAGIVREGPRDSTAARSA